MAEKRKTGTTAWVDPDDAPTFTKAMFQAGEIRQGDVVVRRGRPPLDNPKRAVSLRLDPDVLDRLRALGAGWQGQVNGALRHWLDAR